MERRCNFKSQIWVVLGVSLIFATNLSGASRSGNEKLEFSLPDVFGRNVRSKDYKGVPVFLEFGACW